MTTEELSDPTNFKCDECDFISNWQNGLRVHTARRHRNNIPQYDGEIDDFIIEDEPYEGYMHFWKTRHLGGAYQSYIDAIEVLDDIGIEDDERKMLKEDVLDARKLALGSSFSYYPPWS